MNHSSIKNTLSKDEPVLCLYNRQLGKVAILNGFFRLLVAGNVTKQSYRVKTYNLAWCTCVRVYLNILGKLDRTKDKKWQDFKNKIKYWSTAGEHYLKVTSLRKRGGKSAKTWHGTSWSIYFSLKPALHSMALGDLEYHVTQDCT